MATFVPFVRTFAEQARPHAQRMQTGTHIAPPAKLRAKPVLLHVISMPANVTCKAMRIPG